MTELSRFLVVIDPTADAHPALDRAAWFARQVDAELELFICYYNQYISGEPFFDSKGLQKAREEALGNSKKLLNKLAAPFVKEGLKVTTDAAWDNPLDEGIVRKVMRSAPDIVFKDTHYHSKLRRAFFTNTDWNLIRTCPAPLYLVKAYTWSEENRVIAAVDPVHQHGKPAELDTRILDLAGALASAVKGETHVFHAVNLYDSATNVAAPEPTMLTVGNVAEDVRKWHAEELDKLLQAYALPESQVHVREGHAEKLLPELATELDAALVIMGAVARNPLQRIFIGSTAEKVMDALPCDLLVVKPVWFSSPVSSE
ncbi:MAG: universal stress protein [Gammaproteobacteria bacterium]|nr:universal stress protein [Gammaproteobacteria bacterium]